MKVKVLIVIATIASLFALFAGTGIIVSRGGGPGSQGIVQVGPQASGIVVNRGGGGYEATGAIIQGPSPRA
jgi:hypothetical protein